MIDPIEKYYKKPQGLLVTYSRQTYTPVSKVFKI
jgi:hypothetical protein